MNAITQHQVQAAADYRRAAQFQMRTARESIGWRLSERHGRFDFSHLETRARAAGAEGVQVIWTLMHYGWPQDLDILDEDFVARFARYAAAAARYVARFSSAAPVFVPVHEISYLAWALSESDLMQANRDLRGQGAMIKRQLVRAALAACDAILAVDARARFIHTDPLMHFAADDAASGQAGARRALCYETWDMIAGRASPELGGAPRYLDLVGLNYFPGNQRDLATGAPLDWHLRDPRRADLADLLADVHKRYRRPLLIAETGHTGIGRGAWILEVAEQVRLALSRGVPIEGVCLYSVIDRPDWNNLSHWHSAGLWEVQAARDGTLQRVLNEDYATDLRAAQRNLDRQLRAFDAMQAATQPLRAMPALPALPRRENKSRSRPQQQASARILPFTPGA